MIAASIPEVLMFTGTELSLAREKQRRIDDPFSAIDERPADDP